MPGPARWKLTFFVALCLAATGWNRSRSRSAPSQTHVDPTEAAERDALSPERSAPSDRDIRLANRLARLIERLDAARTGRAACAVIDELSDHHEPRAADVVASVLRDRRDRGTRRCAVDALVSMGTAHALARIAEFVDDEDREVLSAVMNALARSGRPAAITMVRSAALGDRPDQRTAALVALGNAGVREAAAAIDAGLRLAMTPGDRRDLVRALGAAGDPAYVRSIVPLTHDPEAEIQRAAFDALGLLDSPESVRVLVGALHAVPIVEVEMVANALARSRLAIAREALLEAARGSGPIAGASAHALVSVEGDDVRAAMMSLLASEEVPVLTAAIQDVASHRVETAIDRLGDLIDDPRESVSLEAIEAIVRIGGDAAITALERAASRPGPGRHETLVRWISNPSSHDRAIRQALSLARSEGEPWTTDVIELLGQDTSEESRQALLEFAQPGSCCVADAMHALATRSDDATTRWLEGYALASDPGLRDNALGLLAMRATPGSNAERLVLEAARNGPVAARIGVLSVLGSMHTPAAVEALVDAMRSEHEDWARFNAFQSLAAMGIPAANAAIERLRHDPDPAMASIASDAILQSMRYGDSSVRPSSFDDVHSSDPVVRARAIEGLQHVDPAEGRPALLEALHDPSEMAALAAIRGLQSLAGVDAQRALLEVMQSNAPGTHTRHAAAVALREIEGETLRTHVDEIENALQEPTQ